MQVRVTLENCPLEKTINDGMTISDVTLVIFIIKPNNYYDWQTKNEASYVFYMEPYAQEFRAVNILRNTTRCRVMLTVAMFCNTEWHDFLI